MQLAHFLIEGIAAVSALIFSRELHVAWRLVRGPLRVIAGLDPAIHDEVQRMTSVRPWPLRGLMDARVKPAHDAQCVESLRPQTAPPK
jgi:hypothetical protein